jgi:hypothetical protein
MLFCDNYNGGYHLFCFKLEFTQVPTDSLYCSSCSLTTPWLYLDHATFFPTQVWGGDTWKFHLKLLLCIIYICVCIFFWLISFYLWLVLICLFSKIYYGFTPLRHHTSGHYMSRQLFIKHSLAIGSFIVGELLVNQISKFHVVALPPIPKSFVIIFFVS